MKGKNKVVSELSKSNNSIKSKAVAQELNSGSLEDINQIKLKILPYLKKLDSLIGKRQNYLKNISEIDDDLDLLYEDINSIKKDYLNTINKLKKNMNFFNDSLEIIRSAKEEK